MRYVLQVVPSWTELRWRLGPWSPIKRLGFNLHAVQRHGNTHHSVKKTSKCIDKFDIINLIMSYFSKLLTHWWSCWSVTVTAKRPFNVPSASSQCLVCTPVFLQHNRTSTSLHQDSQFTQILASPVDEISVGCDSCNFLGTLCLSAVYFKGSSPKTVHDIIIHQLHHAWFWKRSSESPTGHKQGPRLYCWKFKLISNIYIYMNIWNVGEPQGVFSRRNSSGVRTFWHVSRTLPLNPSGKARGSFKALVKLWGLRLLERV